MAKIDPDHDAAQLEQQIAVLRADIAGLIAALSALRHSAGEALGAGLNASADQSRADGDERLAGAKQTAEAALAEVADYARRKPLHSLAMAGGLGLLFGLLFGRR